MGNIFEYRGGGTLVPQDLVASCLESGGRDLLCDHGALPPEFFDLSTGAAGELLQKLTTYGIRMAVVVPDLTLHSKSFQDLAKEANRGGRFRFVASHAAARAWLAEAVAALPDR